MRLASRHWLFAVNAALGVFIAGALAAPVLAGVGWSGAADALYAAYRFTCHEWAFRSFFLFAPGAAVPVTVYDQQRLADLGVADLFGFSGNAELGWKMAFCERDLAIYLGMLAIGLVYARRRHLPAMRYPLYGLLILPMGIDGFTQLLGWRESTWELRVTTGVVFGIASAWLLLPRLDESFRPVRRMANGTRQPAEGAGQRPEAEPQRLFDQTGDAALEPSPLTGAAAFERTRQTSDVGFEHSPQAGAAAFELSLQPGTATFEASPPTGAAFEPDAAAERYSPGAACPPAPVPAAPGRQAVAAATAATAAVDTEPRLLPGG